MNAASENEIIGLIYDASMNAAVWQQVIDRIVEHTQSKAAILTAVDQMYSDYDFVYSNNLPAESILAYQDERISVIDMRLHAQKLLDVGVGEPEQFNLMHYAEMPGTDEYLFYERCMQPSGIGQFCAVLLEHGHSRWSVLGVHRAKDAPAFERQNVEFIQRISKHLRRGLQIHRQLSIVKQQNHSLQKLLDHMRTGVMLLDEQRSLTYSNQCAQNILQKYNLLSLDRFNRLIVPKHQQEQFDQLVNGIFMNPVKAGREVGGVMAISDGVERSLMISVLPFNDSQNLTDTVMDTSEKHAAIFFTEVDRCYSLEKAYLKQMFGLAKREMELCEYLVNGYSIEEIADTAKITLSTVRTYMKYIYAKTGCSSQTQLIHLLMGTTTNFEHIH